MNRGKRTGEILRHKNLKIYYLFGIFIFINNFHLITSTNKQSAEVGHEVGKTLVQSGKLTLAFDDENLTCQYRGLKLSQEYFGIYAAYGCYNFMRPDLIINSLEINGCLFDGGVVLPALNSNISGTSCGSKFSSNDPVIQAAVQNSFSNENVYNRWLNCCQDAIDCCENHLLRKPPKNNYCSPVWDGWTCFSEYTKAGHDQEMVCSKYAYSGTPPQCNHYSTKTCFNNGTWNDQTDYSTCAISSRLVTRTQWHIAMISISIIISFPGLLLLLVYKQLYTQKYVMIRNLIMAIMCRNLLVLISKSTIIMDELTNTETATIMAKNGVLCRILTFFEKLSANFVFTCMILEGIYLHRLLTNVFGTRRNAGIVKMLFYYIAGICTSILPALVWSILMGIYYNNNCWAVTDGNDLHWINDSPRLAMLVINTILLGHIVIVMWKTFRSKNNEDNPILRTAKASLYCLPLFGVPFLFIIFRPTTESCAWEQFYYFVSYALEGLQCIFVVLFYCYLDREVQRLVTRSINLIQETLNVNKNKKKQSKYEDRRTTYSTFADSRPNNERLSVNLSASAYEDSNSKLQNSFSSTKTSDINTLNEYHNTEKAKCDINHDVLYENLTNQPPLNHNEITKNTCTDKSINTVSITDNDISNFYVNDDHENIFDYYYNDNNINPPADYIKPSIKNCSQKLNDFEDTTILDPKLFFKERANGIQFLDDERLKN